MGEIAELDSPNHRCPFSVRAPAMDPNAHLFVYNSDSDNDSADEYIDDASQGVALSSSFGSTSSTGSPSPLPEFITFGTPLSTAAFLAPMPTLSAALPRPTASRPPALQRVPTNASSASRSIDDMSTNSGSGSSEAALSPRGHDLRGSNSSSQDAGARSSPFKRSKTETESSAVVAQVPRRVAPVPSLSRSNTSSAANPAPSKPRTQPEPASINPAVVSLAKEARAPRLSLRFKPNPDAIVLNAAPPRVSSPASSTPSAQSKVPKLGTPSQSPPRGSGGDPLTSPREAPTSPRVTLATRPVPPPRAPAASSKPSSNPTGLSKDPPSPPPTSSSPDPQKAAPSSADQTQRRVTSPSLLRPTPQSTSVKPSSPARPVSPPQPIPSKPAVRSQSDASKMAFVASTSPVSSPFKFTADVDLSALTYDIASDDDETIYVSEDSYESDGDEDSLVYTWIDSKKNEEDRDFFQKKQEEVLIAPRVEISRIGSVFQHWIRQKQLPPDNPFRKIYDELSTILASSERHNQGGKPAGPMVNISQALNVQVKQMKVVITDTLKRLDAAGLRNRFPAPNIDKLDFHVQSFKLLSSVNARFQNNDGSSMASATQNFIAHLKDLFLWYIAVSAALKS